jgi:hypothetical protein
MMDGVQYYKTLFTEKKKEVVTELEQMINKYPVFRDFNKVTA